jgi:hypothetical protein
VQDAVLFQCDGRSDSVVLRLDSDSDLSLAVNYAKFEVGSPLSLWCCDGHREWGCRFSFNHDMTLSPLKSPGLAVGIMSATDRRLVLVTRHDVHRACVFLTITAARHIQRDIIDHHRIVRESMQREYRAQVLSVCNREALKSLKQDGYMHIKSAIQKPAVNKALKQINSMLGRSTESIQQFQGKSFITSGPVLEMFNDSMLPHLLSLLLDNDDGTTRPTPHPPQRHPPSVLSPSSPRQQVPTYSTSVSDFYSQQHCQLALRFPGDMCPPGCEECPPAHYEVIRKHWHIDGLPGPSIPGVTDHYGTLKTFDMLVGILLSDIDEPNSGELSLYPGSHFVLSEHINTYGVADLCATGIASLPTGERTDETFFRPPVHCLGRAGDVFIVNYLTAHFVAPNSAPHIRYAVYYRVKGRRFMREAAGNFSMESLLNPWVHWEALADIPL